MESIFPADYWSAAAVARKLHKRRVLFRQGDAAARFYVIASGFVRISRCSPDGREVSMAVLGPGETLGEEAVTPGNWYSVTATTCTSAAVTSISHLQLRSCIEFEPAIAMKLLAILQTRLDETSTMIEHLAFDRVRTRLLRFLQRFARERGVPAGDGRAVTLCLTHADIASLIGSTRETVSAELATLARAGWIRVDGSSVTVYAAERASVA